MKKIFIGVVVGIICGIAIIFIWAFLYDGSDNVTTDTVDKGTNAQVQEQIPQIPSEYISILNKYVEEAYYHPETFRLHGDVYVFTASENEIVMIEITAEAANDFGEYTKRVTTISSDRYGGDEFLTWSNEGEESFVDVKHLYDTINDMSPQEREDGLSSTSIGKVEAEKYDGRDVAELMGVEYVEQ